MVISNFSAITTNKPGYTQRIDGSSLPRYDQFFFRTPDDKGDTSTHPNFATAFRDWHGSIEEKIDDC